MRSKWYVPWMFAAPALVVFTALAVFPILWSVGLSFFQWNGILDPVFTGLDNYLRLVNDKVFIQAVVNNLVFMGVGTTAQAVAGMVMAVILLSITRLRNAIKVAYFVPSIISSVAISQIFVRFFSVNPEGVVNSVLNAIGLGDYSQAFLSNPNWSLAIVTLVDAYKFCAIYMVIYYSAFVAIDSEILEAATLDGCNWWQQYVYIKFPIIKAVVLVTIVMLVSGTLKGFDVSYVMTRGGPGASSELVATYMYKTIFDTSAFGYGSAIGVFLTIECLVIVAIVRRVFRVAPDEAAAR